MKKELPDYGMRPSFINEFYRSPLAVWDPTTNFLIIDKTVMKDILSQWRDIRSKDLSFSVYLHEVTHIHYIDTITLTLMWNLRKFCVFQLMKAKNKQIKSLKDTLLSADIQRLRLFLVSKPLLEAFAIFITANQPYVTEDLRRLITRQKMELFIEYPQAKEIYERFEWILEKSKNMKITEFLADIIVRMSLDWHPNLTHDWILTHGYVPKEKYTLFDSRKSLDALNWYVPVDLNPEIGFDAFMNALELISKKRIWRKIIRSNIWKNIKKDDLTNLKESYKLRLALENEILALTGMGRIGPLAFSELLNNPLSKIMIPRGTIESVEKLIKTDRDIIFHRFSAPLLFGEIENGKLLEIGARKDISSEEFNGCLVYLFNVDLLYQFLSYEDELSCLGYNSKICDLIKRDKCLRSCKMLEVIQRYNALVEEFHSTESIYDYAWETLKKNISSS